METRIAVENYHFGTYEKRDSGLENYVRVMGRDGEGQFVKALASGALARELAFELGGKPLPGEKGERVCKLDLRGEFKKDSKPKRRNGQVVKDASGNPEYDQIFQIQSFMSVSPEAEALERYRAKAAEALESVESLEGAGAETVIAALREIANDRPEAAAAPEAANAEAAEAEASVETPETSAAAEPEAEAAEAEPTSPASEPIELPRDPKGPVTRDERIFEPSDRSPDVKFDGDAPEAADANDPRQDSLDAPSAEPEPEPEARTPRANGSAAPKKKERKPAPDPLGFGM